MFANLTALEDRAHAEFCVIGSGPAGMTIARKLAEAGKKVFLFEAGGEEISEESQNIYKGKAVTKGCKYSDLDTNRLRFLGGSSNHWAGACFPIREDIFEARKNIPNGEWPIKKKDLDIYAEEAQHILGISYSNTNKRFIFEVPQDNLAVRNSDDSNVNFRIKYYDKLKRNQNLFVFLNSNLLKLDTNGGRVVSAHFSNYRKETREIRADNFVLATGGIENSRILLYNNIKNNGKLVKNSRTLGKYYMDHLHRRESGILCLFNKVYQYMPNWRYYYLEKEIKEKYNLLDISLFQKKYKNKYILLSFIKELKDLTKIPNIEKSTFSKLNLDMEVEPEIHNAVALGEQVDYFGIPMAELSITISEKVRHTQSFIYKFFAKLLIQHNLGRLKIKPSVWKGDFEGWFSGYHHLGGTRMAENDEWGIVDKNCLVFGQKNLYIAGSSVFTSGAAVNPTYTIVQLALRLADHLMKLKN